MSSRPVARSRDLELHGLLAEIERVLPTVSPETLAASLADLDRIRTLLWTRWLRATVMPAQRGVPSDDQLLGVGQAAAFLGISRTAIRRLELAGTLPAVRIGRRLLFRREVLAQFTEDHERHGRNLD